MQRIRVFMFIGTTAELIKLVPVIQELKKRKIRFKVIASGQNDIHFEEYASVIGDVEIIHAVTPKGKEPSLLLFSFWAIRTFFSLLRGMNGYFKDLNKSNSLFLVHGDTISSLMGSLVARFYGLKLVHIESGLRSYNFLEPFPEEICRFIISRIADIHFCPNEWAVANLSRDKGEKVNTGQNTLIETFWSVMKTQSHHPLLKLLTKQKMRYFILVAHRQEHVLFGRKKTTDLLEFVLKASPKNFQIIFLVHDLSVNFIYFLSKVIPQEIATRMMRIERLPYNDFMQLVSKSEFMVTDGGSNQEELYYMGKPTLLMRNVTERIEGLGENVVLAKSDTKIIRNFLINYKKYCRKPVKVHMRPSKIIINHLFSNSIKMQNI